jgi:hypothetical protein
VCGYLRRRVVRRAQVAHLDQYRGKSLGAQLLVDAQEVDLHHRDLFVVDAHKRGDSGDEGHLPHKCRVLRIETTYLALTRRNCRKAKVYYLNIV